MTSLNFKEILELIEKVAEHGLSSVEVESTGVRVRIEGKKQEPPVFPFLETRMQAPHMTASYPPALQAPVSSEETAAAIQAAAQEKEEEGLHIIPSPIVGTFYRAPSPESPVFINEGDRITKGKVLCIVEAMKLMNEIESDVEGTIVKIYPQNGQPIEFGEKLFAVRL